MTFSIEKEKLPSFSKQSFEVITLELFQQDSESAWEINWRGECLVAYPDGRCWSYPVEFITSSQFDELESYIAANQAEIEKQARENHEAGRADYEYAKYMEERGM